MKMIRWLKTLMGTGYEYQEIAEGPPKPIGRQVPLDEPRPDLEAEERVISAHRRNDLFQEWPVMPMSFGTALQAHDQEVGQEAVVAEVSAAARKAQAETLTNSYAPVLPPTQKTRAMSDEEMGRRDRELRLQLAQDEKSLVPVMRRVA
jgi:hypothetical protein